MCCVIAGTSVRADAVRLVFTTQPQTVVPHTLSGPLTVQMQNGSGTAESNTETFDLSFVSTSQRGKFVSSSGKTISKTMSKGTANRTLYYADDTMGVYTLTVTATGRTTKQSFSATQRITISSTTPPVQQTPIVRATTPVVKTIKKGVDAHPTVSHIVSPVTIPISTTSVSDVSSGAILSPAITSVATVYEGKSETSLFESLLNWPDKLWKWIRTIL